MNAIDTNVLLYSIDRSDVAKQTKAQDLLRQLRSASNTTILLWQVLGKSAHQLRRWRDQGKMTSAEFAQHLQVFRYIFPLMLPTPSTFDYALALADRISVSHWDSMILGACQDAGIAVLYTEDMGSPRIIEGVQLINPFV